MRRRFPFVREQLKGTRMLRSLISAALTTATVSGASEARKAPPAPLEPGKETSIP